MPFFVNAMLRTVDDVCFLDDYSSDGTVQEIESLRSVKNLRGRIHLLTKIKREPRNEPLDRNRLLQFARSLGGTHFLVIDSDELLTSNLQLQELLNICSRLNPGDSVQLQWIQLWRSTDKFRVDKGIWGENYKTFLFADDQSSFYKSDFIHTPRVPNLNGKQLRIKGPRFGVLHFQFSNWDSVVLKHYWYKALERIRRPERSIEVINKRYNSSLNEDGIELANCPSDWIEGFEPGIQDMIPTSLWRARELINWRLTYPELSFKGLDIDWVFIEKVSRQG